jgi:hypothetical protein
MHGTINVKYLRTFVGEAIATVERNHHGHLDRSPTDA